jgi:hypothetical protein
MAHVFFIPDSCNGINILQLSPLFVKLVNGELPLVSFQSNGNYLANDIYPKWATFVRQIQASHGKKELQFYNTQAAVRKIMERPFKI